MNKIQVDVRLTEEQISAIPDFEKQLKRFQRLVDGMCRRDIFRLCLHEAGHIWAWRLLSVDLAGIHGPGVRMRKGALMWMNGFVVPHITFSLDPWMDAAASLVGPLVVEILTGKPNEAIAVEGDIGHHDKCDRSPVDVNERRAVIVEVRHAVVVIASVTPPNGYVRQFIVE